MKKRGISPLIASVLLIEMVFVIAVLVNLFLRGFADEKTQDIEYKTKINEECQKTPLEMTAICKESLSNDLRITMENKGSGTIKGLSFLAVSGDESSSTFVNNEIEGFEKKTFRINAPDYVGKDKLVINYMKNVTSGNFSGSCDSDSIELSVPGRNLLINPGFGDPTTRGDGDIFDPPGSNWTVLNPNLINPSDDKTEISFSDNTATCYSYDTGKTIIVNGSIQQVSPDLCVFKQITNLNQNKEYNVGSKVFIEKKDINPIYLQYRIIVTFNNGEIVNHPVPNMNTDIIGEWQDVFINLNPTVRYCKIFYPPGFPPIRNCGFGSCLPGEVDCVTEKVASEVKSIELQYGVWGGTGVVGNKELKIKFDDAEVRESKIPICED